MSFSSALLYQMLVTTPMRLNPHDQREYSAVTLPNGLKAVLVFDPRAFKAAACLTVGVGHHNNPPEWPGLAHFLEHMLIMGTKKCAQFGDTIDSLAGEFEAFVESHGGETNATTDGLYTEFFFDVIPSHLAGALKRIARFFITPAFDPKHIASELAAVDEEYRLDLNEDLSRIWTVINNLANPSHPLQRFDAGNNASLSSKGKSCSLREAVMRFYREYYHPERMTLAIVAPIVIMDLKRLVANLFVHIPVHPVAPNKIQNLAFTAAETGKYVAIETIKRKPHIKLLFSIAKEKADLKALNYFLMRFRDTGTGSLYQLLLNKNWINGLNVDHTESTHTQDMIYFTIKITQQGETAIDEIMQYFFAYVRFLQQSEPQLGFFTELREYDERELKCVEHDDPLDYARELATDMQKTPLADLLFADILDITDKYNPELIQTLFGYVTPENMLLIFCNNNVQGDLKDPHCNVAYAVQLFSPAQLQQWRETPTDAIFSLPQPNQYMPQKFDLLPATQPSFASPQLVIAQDGGLFWHKQDEFFKLPKLKISLLISGKQEMPFTHKRMLVYRFLNKAISDPISKNKTQFIMAGIDLSIEIGVAGINISIYMYSDKADLVIDTVLELIRNFRLNPARFPAYKSAIKKSLENENKGTLDAQASVQLRDIVYQHAWDSSLLLAELEGVTFDDVSNTLAEYLSTDVLVRGLFLGNLDRQTAITFGHSIIQRFNCTHRTPNDALHPVIQLPNGLNGCYRMASTPADGNLISSYYQAHTYGYKTFALNWILARLLGAKFFTQLRSHEQLGYLVCAQHVEYSRNTGILIVIQSTTYDSGHIQRRIAQFLMDFQKQLANLSAADLAESKQALIDEQIAPPATLIDEALEYWIQIFKAEVDFSSKVKIVQATNSITLADLREYFEFMFLNPDTRRCLTICTAPQREPETHSYNTRRTRPRLNVTMIEDIETFKRGCVFASDPARVDVAIDSSLRTHSIVL